jgi:hypothetical protein
MEIAGLGDVYSVCQTRKSPRRAESGLYGGWAGIQKWLRDQDVTFYRQGLENLAVFYDKYLKEIENYAEK